MVLLSYRLQKPSNTPHHIPLPKQLMVSELHVLYAFFSNSYARPVCLSSHSFILTRLMHDYAKLYVLECSCYAGPDTWFYSCKDKSGAHCKLLCLGSSPGSWREMAHSHISQHSGQELYGDLISACIPNRDTWLWNTNETCWKNKGFKGITEWSSISYNWSKKTAQSLPQ